MEVKINIPQNKYRQPTEIRPHVVQGICEAFLDLNAWSTFHPFQNGCYRNPTLTIVRHENDKKFFGFRDAPFDSEEGIRFNGAEMKAAFEALQKAGYYLFKVYLYGSWMGYKCSCKPFLQDGTRVTTFNDYID